ncbi:hypothetical protein [Chryseobacterium fistulae]|uniref:Bacteriocin n=1 Tax=Chryseobacterium fistulae TaxID=2675058 RepID=A0A6N4XT82_9FLAO|nr:hypothetical protein [Chryseobacterium fistulae]CAA7392635.1 hypothetical protein CHRY9393_03361 [Chryseobacterium fistulae]
MQIENSKVEELTFQEMKNIEGGDFIATAINYIGNKIGTYLYNNFNNYPYPLINQYNSFAPIPGSYYY